jgi:hypothetical protein
MGALPAPRGVPFLSLLVLLATGVAAAGDKVEFWNEPQAGANFANRVERGERLAAARDYGIGWIRLAPDKWESDRRGFLLGDCDAFAGVVEADLARLAAVVDTANSLGLKVVIALRSLLGARWRDPHAKVAADSAAAGRPRRALLPTSPTSSGLVRTWAGTGRSMRFARM